MHHNPKINNLIALAEWFEAGAPDWTFDMERGLAISYTHDGEVIDEKCGTAGCIAGAAYAMALNRLPNNERKRKLSESGHDGDEFSWYSVQDVAMDFLGLPFTPGCRHNHPLFGTLYTPSGCTTQDAAAAIRRVIAGHDPWPPFGATAGDCPWLEPAEA